MTEKQWWLMARFMLWVVQYSARRGRDRFTSFLEADLKQAVFEAGEAMRLLESDPHRIGSM